MQGDANIGKCSGGLTKKMTFEKRLEDYKRKNNAYI